MGERGKKKTTLWASRFHSAASVDAFSLPEKKEDVCRLFTGLVI